MKETLICSLEKHNIYYLSDANVSFYILVPYKEYDNTNISIRLKSNYDSYDLTKNSLEVVTNELINYYKNLDNYNITLILPVFYNNILDIPKEITEDFEVIDISNTELTDFTTLYLHKLKTEHNISEELLLKINNFLKDDTNVSFSID